MTPTSPTSGPPVSGPPTSGPPVSGPPVSGAAIEVHSLTRRFGDVLALDAVSLSVPPASVLGLLGPNGAGKTTLVRMLATLLPPTSGSASVLGHDVVSSPQAVRSLIGLAGQYAGVDENLTGRENLYLVARLLSLPRPRAHARADELLERFDLADASSRTVRTYSGGMRRRLDLAAALVSSPPVLFLDEPTTGLDPRSRLSLWEVVEDLVASGTTLLLTTQYLEEADRLASHLAVVDHGRIITEGAPAELKARHAPARLVIRLHPEDLPSAQAALSPLAASLEADPAGSLTLLVPGAADEALARAAAALASASLTPLALSASTPTLDEVFLSVTGRPLDPDPSSPEDAS